MAAQPSGGADRPTASLCSLLHSLLISFVGDRCAEALRPRENQTRSSSPLLSQLRNVVPGKGAEAGPAPCVHQRTGHEVTTTEPHESLEQGRRPFSRFGSVVL